jgi:hypothetical protein
VDTLVIHIIFVVRLLDQFEGGEGITEKNERQKVRKKKRKPDKTLTEGK